MQRFKSGRVCDGRHSKASQYGRNRRNESKNIMQKLASIKLCDVSDDLISLPHMENHTQEPDKPPPPCKVPNALPNYMKHTRSSGAKKDSNEASVSISNGVFESTSCEKYQTRRNLKIPKAEPLSLKLARNLTKCSSFKQTGSLQKSISDKLVLKGTCSSLLKDFKFPSEVMLSSGASESRGASSMEVCTYKYCSLNEHCHKIVLPLKKFISDRRRSLKKQKCLKIRNEATRKVPFIEETELQRLNFFVDIEEESDTELYESLWEAYGKEIQEFEYIEAQLEEEVVIFSYNVDLVDKEMISAEDKENAGDDQMENKSDHIDRESIELNQSIFVCAEENGESEIGNSGMKIIKCKRAEEDSDSGKDFNPHEPNYLPLEQGPKAEQVDLKHQDTNERKNSEEWMVDYALQKTVTKLAPVKRKKVELLVEAFESVA